MDVVDGEQSPQGPAVPGWEGGGVTTTGVADRRWLLEDVDAAYDAMRRAIPDLARHGVNDLDHGVLTAEQLAAMNRFDLAEQRLAYYRARQIALS